MNLEEKNKIEKLVNRHFLANKSIVDYKPMQGYAKLKQKIFMAKCYDDEISESSVK